MNENDKPSSPPVSDPSAPPEEARELSASPAPSGTRFPVGSVGAVLALFLLLGIAVVVMSRGGRPYGDLQDPHANHGHGTAPPPPSGDVAAPSKAQLYMCPMMCVEPTPDPGRCPVCGMDLVPMPDDMAGGDRSLPRLTMSEAAMQLANVQLTTVRRAYIAMPLRLTGFVAYDETRVRKITAWSAGRIERLFVDASGIEVNRGDDLFDLYSQALVAPQSSLIVADQALRGVRQSSYSREENEQAVAGAGRRLRLMGLMDDQIDAIAASGRASSTVTIRAPITGTVVDKNAQEGMYANEGTVLYVVADLTNVWVQLDAYETDLAFLRYGQPVTLRTEAFADEPFHGRISFIDPTLDRTRRTVGVRVVVENPARRLRPGMFVRATVQARLGEGGAVIAPEGYDGTWISPRHPEIVLDAPGACPRCGIPLVQASALGYTDAEAVAPALVVPHTAVLYTGTRGLVYVRDPEEPTTVFEAAEVELGPRAGDVYVIRSGLREGQEIAAHGAFRIDAALQLVGRPSMMRPSTAGATTPRPAPAPSRAPDVPHEFTLPPVEAQAVPEAVAVSMAGVLRAYYDVQQAYGNDDPEAGRKGLEAIRTALSGVDAEALPEAARVDWNNLHARIERTVALSVETEDLEAMRGFFSPMSVAVEEMARRFGPFPGVAVHRAFCPMAFDDAGAYWLQESKEILNPYEGSRMPRCGVIREEIFP